MPVSAPLAAPDAPPFGLGLPPARGTAGRLRDAALRALLDRVAWRGVLRGANAARVTFGLPPHRDLTEHLGAIPLLLALTAEPFEYPRAVRPANLRLVGPCAWDPPADPPAWLADLEQPIVLVTTSSEFQDDGRLVRVALAALADAPVRVVATVPAGDAGIAAPAHARVVSFIPHGPVLERAACAVTHGGMGATQKALAHGVPVCAAPFGRDQFEVARRVEVAGAGTRLPAARLTPARLRAAVAAAMRCGEGARRVAAGFRAAGGPASAADALEALAAGG